MKKRADKNDLKPRKQSSNVKRKKKGDSQKLQKRVKV